MVLSSCVGITSFRVMFSDSICVVTNVRISFFLRMNSACNIDTIFQLLPKFVTVNMATVNVFSNTALSS